MDTFGGQPKARWHSLPKVLGILLGVCAVATMVTLVLAQANNGSANGGIPLAGSGDAPTNTTFTQPVVGQMKIGSTATASTASSSVPTG